MSKLFLLFAILYIGQFVLRTIFAIIYYKKNNNNFMNANHEEEFCIVQALKSGDDKFEDNLKNNLDNFSKAKFVWLIDKIDINAIAIANDFQKSYSNIEIVLIDDIPNNVNPKTYKLNFSIPYLKKYCIFLDDDCVINNKHLSLFYQILHKNNCVISTVPYYKSEGFWNNLLATSANMNSILFYLPTALMNDIKTITGMCYITTKDVIVRTKVFEKTKDKLFDDLAFFDVCLENNIEIYQSIMPNINCIEIKNIKQYVETIKRWNVFANMHIIKYLCPLKFTIVTVAMCLPMIMLILSIILGIKYFILLLMIHFIKTFILIHLRQKFIGIKERPNIIIYEFLAEHIQIFTEIYTIFNGNKFKWRDKIVKIKGNEFVFEEIK